VSENKGHGLLDAAGVGFGVACGVGALIQIVFAIIVFFVGDDDEASIQIRKEKRAWWRSLSWADRWAFIDHKRRMRAYIRLRRKAYNEIRRRCYVEFKARPPKPEDSWRDRQVQVASRLWDEWGMKSWEYIYDYPDYKTIHKDVMAWPWDGGNLDRSRFLPKKPLWTPPVWR
jgi:hypothetical protein